MNYLAHLLLSGDHPDWQLGGFLGDFVKGPLSPAPLDQLGQPWSAEVVAGIRLHRSIDHFVDHHPLFKQALSRLGPDMRRVGGIALDVCFDHYLASHWSQFHSSSLEDYCQSVYTLLMQQQSRMPDRAQVFSERMQAVNLLAGYQDADIVRQVLERVAGRLRYQTVLDQAYVRLQQHHDDLLADFLDLIPALLQFAQQEQSRYRAS